MQQKDNTKPKKTDFRGAAAENPGTGDKRGIFLNI